MIRVCGLCLFVGLLIYLLARKPEGISVAVNGDHLSLSYASGEAVTIQYSDILSVEEIVNLEPGQIISGAETKAFKYGIWQNEEFGKYHVCIYTKVPRAVLVTATTGRYVFNFDSEDATNRFYAAFVQMLQEQQAVAAP